jgi:hypothetical protein
MAAFNIPEAFFRHAYRMFSLLYCSLGGKNEETYYPIRHLAPGDLLVRGNVPGGAG